MSTITAVLVAEVDAPVRVQDGGRVGSRVADVAAPGHLSGLELHADREPLVVPVAGVDVVPYEDEAAVVVLEGLGIQEVALPGLHAVAGLLQLEKNRTGPVAGRREHQVPRTMGVETLATPFATRL